MLFNLFVSRVKRTYCLRFFFFLFVRRDIRYSFMFRTFNEKIFFKLIRKIRKREYNIASLGDFLFDIFYVNSVSDIEIFERQIINQTRNLYITVFLFIIIPSTFLCSLINKRIASFIRAGRRLYISIYCYHYLLKKG